MDAELKPKASLRGAAMHVLKATKLALDSFGSKKQGFLEIVKDAVEHKDVIKETNRNLAQQKQASIIQQVRFNLILI